MFHLACIFYLLIVLYSFIYQMKVVINYKKNKKIKIKEASGLYVSKYILNKNDLGTLYVTKINKKYNDHYDIERNVIRLSNEVYDEENMASLTTAFYQTLKALLFQDKSKRKENKMKFLILDIINKISFILFIVGAYSKDLGMMILCLALMILVIVIRYSYIEKYNNLAEKNIEYLKKEYKLKPEDINKIEKTLNTLILNEISIQLFNCKY